MSTTPAPVPLAAARVVVVNWRDLEHSLAGGSERYAWELSRALRSAGADVEFVTAREPGSARRVVRDGIVVRRGGGRFGFYAYAAWRLLRRRRSVDVVIDPSCGIPCFSPLLVRRGTPVVLVMHHVHQQQFATYFGSALARFGQWLERVAMPRVYRNAHVVAVSPSTREEMADQLGWRGPVGLLENGSEEPYDGSVDDKDPQRLVVLGRLVEHKRVELVLEAMHRLAPQRPGLHLDVVGRGPESQRLQRRAAELGIADRVTFHGFVDDATKHQLLARAALHVCASDAEGWGQVVVETAGFGIPTVARDVPGLRDSVRSDETGWLAPEPADHDLAVVADRLTTTLEAALSELEDHETRTLAFKAAQAWAASFGWSRMHRRAVALVVAALDPSTTPAESATICADSASVAPDHADHGDLTIDPTTELTTAHQAPRKR